MNHFQVFTRDQLKHALLAGAYPTYEAARSNPFTVELAGTPLRLKFPRGLHERDAQKMARNVGRTPAKAFKP
jgi:hypothetical protein